VAHRAIHFEIQLCFVDGNAFLTADEQTGQSFIPWKAADVGR
jgi:hypothetical protein